MSELQGGFLLFGAVFGGESDLLEEQMKLHKKCNALSEELLTGITIGPVKLIHVVLRFSGHLHAWNELPVLRRVTRQANGTTLGLEIVFKEQHLRHDKSRIILLTNLPAAMENALKVKSVREYTPEVTIFRKRFGIFMEALENCTS